MDDQPALGADEEWLPCPFLYTARDADSETESHACLSRGGDHIVISPRYVAVFCRTPRHTQCDLYLRADPNAREEAEARLAQELAAGQRSETEAPELTPNEA